MDQNNNITMPRGPEIRSTPRAAKRSKRLIWIGLILVLGIGAGLYLWLGRAQQAQPAQGPAGAPGGPAAGAGARRGAAALGGPMAVVTATAVKGDMPVTLNALGTVTPLATVTVKAQIGGQLQKIAFEEGQMVKAGDFLAQVDPRPYQAALDQAQGTLAHDQALLANALVDLKRYQTLVAQDSIASQTLDTQRALVEQYKGTVATDQALVHNAQLNLAYCHIVSPVTGKVGLRQVDQGNYVQLGDANGLVVVTQLEPITVLFSIPEDSLPPVLKRAQSGASLPVTAFDRSGATKLATGVLATIDNQIDTTTGMLKMKARFENTDHSLFPNQFVNAQLLVDTQHDATLIPMASVQRGAQGTYVYVVAADSTVTAHVIKLGPGDATNVAVISGVNPGDVVVVDGADKLRDGAKVVLPNATPPAAAAPADGAQPQHKKRDRGSE
jgi:multidrug efflux system membrane fusion protein